MSGPGPADDADGPFTLSPIGYVRSPYQRRFGTPQQASAVDSAADAVLALIPTLIPSAALADLEGMEQLWVLSQSRVQRRRGNRLRSNNRHTRVKAMGGDADPADQAAPTGGY